MNKNYMKYSMLNLCLILIAFNSFGQKKELLVDPIDSVLSLCIENDLSTLRITIYCNQAEQKWEKLADKYYSLLLGGCGTQVEKQALKNAKELWEKYRIADLQVYCTLFNIDGTMWSVVRFDASTNLIKKLVIQLREYYETLNQH